MSHKRLALLGIAFTLALSACAAAAPSPTAAPAAAAVPTMVLPTTAPAGSAAEAAPAAAPAADSPAGAPTINVGVSASGEVTARQSAELSFRVPGVVAAILVDEGAQVRAGQELVRLDTAELELAVRQAEAGLAQAQAGYERLLEGASDEEIAAARAQVAQAQAGLRQTRGSVTDQDIAAAEANLQSALARQVEVEGGPKSVDLTTAQSAVDQARAGLEIQRTNLSAGKTNAELQIDLAANAVRDAQKVYSEIYWKNRDLERKLDDFGIELPKAASDAEQQAMRGVQSAEARLEQARLGYEQAKQNELEGLQAAEAQLRTADANLQRVLDGAGADQRSAVAAQVAQARAQLDKLKGDQRAGGLQAAAAGVAAAQANLDRASADPSTATLAGVGAQVEQAKTAVEAARLNLAKATLTAPFAGIVANINVDVGDSAAGGALPAVQIVDVSELRVEVNVSDTDVARVREGMPVEITVDAIPGKRFTGVVSYIAPTANLLGNVRTYPVRVTLDAQDAGLRAGMSARVAIQVQG